MPNLWTYKHGETNKMKVIIFRKADGGVGVVNPTPKAVDNLMAANEISEDAAIALIALKDVPVELTENGIINKINVSAGDLVKREDADLSGIAHKNIPQEMVDPATLPIDQPRDSWEWV